jgi:hypothetical protein
MIVGDHSLTWSPQGCLLWYFAIWPRNILLAAYFPTIAAMFAMLLWGCLSIKWCVD